MRRSRTLLLLFTLAACPAQARSRKAPAPPPEPPAAPAAKSPLTPGDRLQINVVGEKDLSKEYVIDEGGSVQLDMIGAVKAAGLTVEEFQPVLEKQLARYIRKPSFTLFAFKKIGVGGGVHQPGAFDFPKDQPVHLMDVLLRAGGLVREAKKNRVLLIRRATAGGTPNSQLFDIGKYLRKGEPQLNPLLGPNDMVYVDVEDPERRPRGAAALLEKALPLAGALLRL